jgi:hypothetical protein
VTTSVSGTVTDNTGNNSSTSFGPIKIDKTAPTIVATAKNADGTTYVAGTWTNQSVTVHFTCSDTGGSGILTCPADTTLTADGTNLSVSGTATDYAGNSTSASFGSINIDKTGPTLNPVVSPNPVLLKGTATITPGAVDGGTGVASQSCGTLDTSTVGTKSVTCTATDNAGNTKSATVTYQVIYRFDGFLQPINDTNHTQVCGAPCPISVFKGGSTVPVTFQLKDAFGNIVQSASLPLWLTPQKGSTITGSVDETVYSNPATTGSTYYWDSTTQKYTYNWSTKGYATGYLWRIGVTLDDGQTYFVYIGLK